VSNRYPNIVGVFSADREKFVAEVKQALTRSFRIPS